MANQYFELFYFRLESNYLGDADEKLAAVGRRSCIGHAKNTRTGVLEREVLVLKFGSVDGRSSRAVCVLKIAALVQGEAYRKTRIRCEDKVC